MRYCTRPPWKERRLGPERRSATFARRPLQGAPGETPLSRRGRECAARAYRGGRDELLYYRYGGVGAGEGVAGRKRDPGRTLQGPAARRACGPERHHIHQWRPYDDGLRLLFRTRPRPQRDRRAEAGRGGIRPYRQDQHARVRLRSHRRPFALRSNEKSPRYAQDNGRLQWRLGGRGRGKPLLRRARLGHGRLHPDPRGPLRYRRHEADLRAGEQERCLPTLLEPRPRRSHHPHRGGQRPDAERPGRPRPGRPLLGRPTRRGLYAGSPTRTPGSQYRSSDELLFRSR